VADLFFLEPPSSLRRRRVSMLLAPAIAATAAVIVTTWGWRGVDLAAHVYSINLFHHEGLRLWDGQWFGGHWTLGYTVIYTPLAATLGVHVTAILSAAGAALAFDRLVSRHFHRRALLGAVLFAFGTVAQVAIGQLPFLMGEALALAALVAASRRRWWLACLLAVAASLSSPLAGAFLGLALAAWIVATWPRDNRPLLVVTAAAMLPVGALQLMFPQGRMPFAGRDFALELAVFACLAALIPRRERLLRAGAFFYLAMIVASYVVPSGMGGNIARLGGCVALPLAICAVDDRRRQALALAVLAPVIVLVWAPVWTSATTGRTDPSASRSYYAPLVSYLAAHRNPAGRVEVVPTALHWETVYVAPVVPLARGWERQVDATDNPIFYRDGALTPATYDAWLRRNGVRYVAIADARVDYSGRAEQQLLGDPEVAGLQLVWYSAHWRVFAVPDSSGILTGPGRLTRMTSDELEVRAMGTSPITLRIHPTKNWMVTQGDACLHPQDGALEIHPRHTGDIVLRIEALPPSDAQTDAGGC
jgi:hypothetical protein